MWWWGKCVGCNICSCLNVISNSTSRFELTEILSKNDCGGDVYWAKNIKNGSDVAVKVIPKKVLKDTYRRRKIRHEVKMLSSLHHPNIVRLYGVYESSDSLEVAFELSKGGEVMRRYISPHAEMYNFCEAEISRVVKDIVSALVYMHGRRIIHGDIRPEHILYSSVDPESKALLVDFGNAGSAIRLSTLMSSLVDNIQKYNDVSMARYIAPVILQKKRIENSYDSKRSIELSFEEATQIDIWSLGVVIYLMLFGSYPFDSNNVVDIEEQILKGKYTFPDELDHEVSRAAKDLIHDMLQLDPGRCIPAHKIQSHPWIQSGAASSYPFSERHLAKLRDHTNDHLRSRFLSTPVSSGQISDGEEILRSRRPSVVSTDGVAVEDGRDFVLHASNDCPDSFMRQAEVDMRNIMISASSTDEIDHTDFQNFEDDSKRSWKLFFGSRRFPSFGKSKKEKIGEAPKVTSFTRNVTDL